MSGATTSTTGRRTIAAAVLLLAGLTAGSASATAAPTTTAPTAAPARLAFVASVTATSVRLRLVRTSTARQRATEPLRQLTIAGPPGLRFAVAPQPACDVRAWFADPGAACPARAQAGVGAIKVDSTTPPRGRLATGPLRVERASVNLGLDNVTPVPPRPGLLFHAAAGRGLELGYTATLPAAGVLQIDQPKPAPTTSVVPAAGRYDVAAIDVTLGGPVAPGFVRLPACPVSGALRFVATERLWTGRSRQVVALARC